LIIKNILNSTKKNEQNNQTKKEMKPKYAKKFVKVQPKMKKSAETESSNQINWKYKEGGPEIDYLEKNEGKKIIGRKYIKKL